VPPGRSAITEVGEKLSIVRGTPLNVTVGATDPKFCPLMVSVAGVTPRLAAMPTIAGLLPL
jgi:hypothetical protein